MKSFALISAVSLLAAGQAFAQAAPQSDAAAANPPAAAAEAPAAGSVSVSDDELKRFAEVAAQAKKIMSDYQPKIAAAADDAAKAKAQSDMSGELQVAVTDKGFTVQRYNEIATAMQKDQGLLQRMQQLAAGPSSSTTSSQ